MQQDRDEGRGEGRRVIKDTSTPRAGYRGRVLRGSLTLTGDMAWSSFRTSKGRLGLGLQGRGQTGGSPGDIRGLQGCWLEADAQCRQEKELWLRAAGLLPE